MSRSLHLNVGRARPKYKLHPAVVLAILDHYKRRNEDQFRVVGTLLGEKQGNSVVIKNSFPMPHSEKEDQVTMDMEYHSSMLDLHKRVNPRETVVGWYATGDQINYISSLVHDVYKTFLPNPVHLVVDVAMTNNRLGLRAYRGKPFKVGDKGVIYRFEEAELEIEAYEGEKIAVDALLNGNPENDNLDAPATILSDFENLENSLTTVLSAIETVSEYVSRVVDGSIKGDPEIGRAINSALASIPQIDPESFERTFNSHVQDLLMIVYLSNLTKSQLALADRMQGLF